MAAAVEFLSVVELNSEYNNAPIGIFDSGFGGLTVARAVMDQLGGESIMYIGDGANGPYGPKPIADVRQHATAIAIHLDHSRIYSTSIDTNTI